MTTIKDTIVRDETIDKYFPMGDKRRGEVLVIIGVLCAMVDKAVGENIDKFRNLTLNENNISQNFIELSDFNYHLNQLEFGLGLAEEEKEIGG